MASRALSVIVTVVLLALGGRAVLAQPSPVTIVPPGTTVAIAPGGEASVSIPLRVAKSYHVYAPNNDGYIPLAIASGDAAVSIRAVKLPEPKRERFPGIDQPIAVLEGAFEALVTLAASPSLAAGPRMLRLDVSYQACTSESCLDPRTEHVDVNLLVLGRAGAPAAAGEVSSVTPTGLVAGTTGASAVSSTSTGDVTSVASSASASTDSSASAKAVAAKPASHVSLWLMLGAFGAGLLVTLTPCVYPVIPVTISYFQQQAKTRAQAGVLAIAYGAPIIVMYAVLGVGMARLGHDLGWLLGNPIVGWGFVALFAFLAFSMFGYYDLQLPSSWQTKLQSGERGGVFGAALLGLTMSLVAAPCVGPFATGLMAVVAQTGDIVFGLTAFGSFGLGIAAPFMALGVFSGALGSIPRAGEWMDKVKHILGYVLLAFAIDFVYIASGSVALAFACAGALLLVAGTAALAVENVLARALAVALAVAGVYFLFGPYVLKPGGPIVTPAGLFESRVVWQADHDHALAEARAQGKPVMVDFTARWCNACHELELTTFREDAFLAEARRFAFVRVDVTNDERSQRIKNDVYHAFSIPFLAFYDGSGKLVSTLPRPGSSGITTEDVVGAMKEVR